jgi:hypothetical protein
MISTALPPLTHQQCSHSSCFALKQYLEALFGCCITVLCLLTLPAGSLTSVMTGLPEGCAELNGAERDCMGSLEMDWSNLEI